MLTDLTLGQYYPGNSLLYRLDPRMKLVLTLLYIIAVFIPHHWVGLGVTVFLLIGCLLLSRLPLKLIWRSIKPLLILIVLTSLLNMFYVTGGEPLLDWWIIHITTRGVSTAVFISVRIVCLVTGSSLLTYTTTPTALTDAIEYLLAPLKIIHVDPHDLAMMMTIALRFIPTLMEETDKIIAAQKARGADFESGNLLRRVKALVPILIPLFVSSFRRAYDLATAMECRCYQGGEGRTRMKRLQTAARDWIALAVAVTVMAGLILLNVVFPSVL